MTAVLALDQGTTGSTALVIHQDGTVRGRAYSEFRQHFPRPGWVEHDPEEIWQVTLGVARQAVEQAGETPSAIGITNQRETVIAWDRRTGRPLHNAIVWQDRRTTARCRDLRLELGDAFVAERTGLVWDPYFSATKIEWLLHNVPAVAEAARGGRVAFGTVDAWLIFRLSGNHTLATDPTNASRTLLYNIQRRVWDDELLALFGVRPDMLPAVVPSSGVMASAAREWLGREIPIAGAAGDQQAALFGQACWRPGQAKGTYGTGAFVLMYAGAQPGSLSAGTGVLTTVAVGAAGEPAYALEGSVFIAGAAVQWLRDGLGLVKAAQETEALARSVDDTGGVYFVPALVGLGAPHWEPEARGTIVGITRGTKRAHLVRAALEAIAFATRDVVDAMSEAARVPLAELRVDGGAAANDWLMQFQADALGVPVLRPDLVETTALGAAGLAGLATGVWPDAAAFEGGRTYARFEPRPLDGRRHWEWKRAVKAALYWARSTS